MCIPGLSGNLLVEIVKNLVIVDSRVVADKVAEIISVKKMRGGCLPLCLQNVLLTKVIPDLNRRCEGGGSLCQFNTPARENTNKMVQ